MATIDPYSVSTVPIEMYFNDTPLSLGTSFIWEKDNRHFLITNWHNVSGKSAATGKHLSTTAAEPNWLHAWMNHKSGLGNKFPCIIEILDANGHPVWWVHPKFGRSIDVVAIPIVPNENAAMYAINQMPNEQLALMVGMDVFILGYPFGLGPSGLPIWKRGSIASEPEIFSDTQQFMLVDAASRPGMSGSPVIRRSWGTHFLAEGGVTMNAGVETMFVGIYSGRLATNDTSDPQLGLTWPANLVEQIIAGAQIEPR
ncbi:MAG: trypsin-like peptidase domain-containing protein [Methylocystis sp.]|uniref:S1 family peptidase n=1 Tax=Methylocystis sp. TaxID=1911079 RepID=UPI00395C793D